MVERTTRCCPGWVRCHIVRATHVAPMTVLEVLQSTTAYFKKRGVESPRLNAEHLLAHVLKRKRIEIYLEFERTSDGRGAGAAAGPGQAARAGGAAPAFARNGGVLRARLFLCDKRALVPRPETEQLVELLKSAISQIRNPASSMSAQAAG